MKLYYFDMPGRAEVSRIMLRLKGIPFDDIRIKHQEWIPKYKKMSPTWQVPMLELDDGTKIAQMSAIEIFIGKKTGFLPSDDVLCAKALMMGCCVGDVRHHVPLLRYREFHVKCKAKEV